MAKKFRKVDPRIWTDEKFRRLDSNGKLLALWMLTSIRVNRCGIVLWSPGLASEETGISPSIIETVCDTVCDTLSWVWDTASGTVFLRRWWRYNRPDNEKALRGFLSDLHDVPTNGLLPALSQAVQDLPSKLHTVYLRTLETAYNTVQDTVSPQEKEKEKEKEKETEQEPPIVPQGTARDFLEKENRKPATYGVYFEDFWGAVAPHKRKSKMEAARRYKEAVKAIRTRDGVEDPHAWLRERAVAYYGSPLGQTPYCHIPSAWLHKGGYDDDPAAWERADEDRPHEPVDIPYKEY